MFQRGIREIAWYGSVVEGITVGPRPNNNAFLDRSEWPYRDRGGRMEWALRQHAEADAGTITRGALFIQLTGGFIL
jgi:hypothetical protein